MRRLLLLVLVLVVSACTPSPATTTPTTKPAATVALATPTPVAAPKPSPFGVASPSPAGVASPSPAVLAKPSPAPAVTVTLTQQSNSGVAGTAVLTDLGGGRTRVVVNVAPAGNANMPSHIHEGTCSNLNPAPKYPLNNVTDGQATSEVAAPLSDLTKGGLAINLHRSPQDVATYTACGEIPRVS